MPGTADTAFPQAPQSSQADEIQNNVDILMAGSGVMQPRTAQAPEARGSDAVAYKARVAQLERAARRLVELAGNPDREANNILVSSLRKVSARNFPDSVQRMLEPVLAKIPPQLPSYKANVQRARDFRPVARQNPDGSVSTVRFSSYGTHVAPTLFPNEGATPDPKDWTQLEGMEAYKEAKKRGEIFEFGSESEARKFAEGDWKVNSKFDPKTHREAAAKKALE